MCDEVTVEGSVVVGRMYLLEILFVVSCWGVIEEEKGGIIEFIECVE